MATTLNTPDVLTQPIATNGDKNSIPNTNDGTQGLMSQSLGFPAICSERIADGGKAPKRADFNGAFNLISQQHYFFQNGGTATFRADVSSAIGGYPLNARLWWTDNLGNSRIVRSTIQNNTYDFTQDSSYIGKAGSGNKWEIEEFVDSLNTKYVSNCITAIPQDIKLELSSGTLTLKSGSVITSPSGAQYKTTANKTVSISTDGQWMIFANMSSGAIGNYKRVNSIGSGNSLPADNSTFSGFLNTTDNQIYQWSSTDNEWKVWSVSFPVCIVTASGGSITSIDKAFNGFGYMGHHAFVLPNVSYLVPQGIGTDGTMNSFSRMLNSVYLIESTTAGSDRVILGTRSIALTSFANGYVEVEQLPETGTSNKLYYVPSANYAYQYYQNHWSVYNATPLGTITTIDDSGVKRITDVQPRPVVRLAKQEDLDGVARRDMDNTFTQKNTFTGEVAMNGTVIAGATVRAIMIAWGIPDTSRAEQIVLPYTTTEDCYIAFKHTGNSDAGRAGNGIVVDGIYGCAAMNGIWGQSGTYFQPVMYGGLYVASGATVEATSTYGTYEVWMIPLKGIPSNS